jgi:hypothetical protein
MSHEESPSEVHSPAFLRSLRQEMAHYCIWCGAPKDTTITDHDLERTSFQVAALLLCWPHYYLYTSAYNQTWTYVQERWHQTMGIMMFLFTEGKATQADLDRLGEPWDWMDWETWLRS